MFVVVQDVWNGVAGGLAAGLVIAVKTQRGVVGAGAGLCYAALSAITEYNDNTLAVIAPHVSLPPLISKPDWAAAIECYHANQACGSRACALKCAINFYSARQALGVHWRFLRCSLGNLVLCWGDITLPVVKKAIGLRQEREKAATVPRWRWWIDDELGGELENESLFGAPHATTAAPAAKAASATGGNAVVRAKHAWVCEAGFVAAPMALPSLTVVVPRTTAWGRAKGIRHLENLGSVNDKDEVGREQMVWQYDWSTRQRKKEI
jgi:hypothetical protein